jgi:hypothetical protein
MGQMVTLGGYVVEWRVGDEVILDPISFYM